MCKSCAQVAGRRSRRRHHAPTSPWSCSSARLPIPVTIPWSPIHSLYVRNARHSDLRSTHLVRRTRAAGVVLKQLGGRSDQQPRVSRLAAHVRRRDSARQRETAEARSTAVLRLVASLGLSMSVQLDVAMPMRCSAHARCPMRVGGMYNRCARPVASCARIILRNIKNREISAHLGLDQVRTAYWSDRSSVQLYDKT